ncbi:MAG: bifunctional hydroxymethylpyrimidine kinase/phosphomethylpyrimidine kinase [Halanaerobiaceae bacterium]
MKKVLTIAGSDSGGGAGIQADLKTFSALGVYGMSVITSVTAQNTAGVTAVEDVSPEVVAAQMDAVFSDIEVDAVKIGMVSNIGIIRAVTGGLEKWNAKKIVLDPVMISESGSHLLQKEARTALIKDLIPLADIITPNLYEAEALLEKEIVSIDEMEGAAVELAGKCSTSVLVKGGHLVSEVEEELAQAVDIYYDGSSLYRFKAPRINTVNTHGTGCTYSSAIAAFLAMGFGMKKAIDRAKYFITEAIKYSLDIGEGPGPANPLYNLLGKKFYK